MEALCHIQLNASAAISKDYDNFKKAPKERLSKSSYINTRLENLDKKWDIFMDTHREIVKIVPTDKEEEHEYFTEEVFSTAEEEYIIYKAELTEMLEKLSIKNTTKDHTVSCSSMSQEVKLPKINIPLFSGNYNDWGTFNDLYSSLIHNNNTLSNVQKLHYLKSSVTGEAEQLLKHIQITEANYQVAWGTLKQRYNNKRIIVNAILNRFLGQRKLNAESARGIKELLDTNKECLNNLSNHGVTIKDWDPLIIHLSVNKLDQESHRLWEEELRSLSVEQLPTLAQFHDFLEGRFRVLEMIQTQSTQSRENRNVRAKTFYVTTNDNSASSDTMCTYCKENHYLYLCKDFIELDPQERSDFVQSKRLCFNCLWPGHSVMYCRHTTSCRICKRKHHTLLHVQKKEATNENTRPRANERESTRSITDETDRPRSSANEVENSDQTRQILSHVSTRGHVTLLATALVNIETPRGAQTVRALIDPCSQESFISETVVRKLQLKRSEIRGQVTGVGGMSAQIEHTTELKIQSRIKNNFELRFNAFVVKQVTDVMPANHINIENWSHVQGLELADPTYHIPGQIDLLLGVNVYADILMSGVIRGDPGTPIAQQTHLGWIISGGQNERQEQNNIVSMHLNVSLDRMLTRFWEIEAFDDNKNNLTSKEVRAEELYEKTVQRQSDGRYVVALPFENENPVLPENSRNIAMKRLKHLERKLANNEKLKIEYDKVMKDYIAQNHMSPTTKQEIGVVYLPHHAVIREDKKTTKVRVVFDASSEGTNGKSLNDELLVGPPLQEELRDIIMRWRTHRVCFVADIVQMYRQIRVREKDTEFQRILYRFNPTDEVQDYKMLTVTFGTASAPYLAIRTLRQLAQDEKEEYPKASEIINRDFYMDDVLSGFSEESKAIEAQKELSEIMNKGGFTLQKWASNSEIFLNTIDPEKRAKGTELDINRNECIKTLGIIWEMKDDSLKVAQKSQDMYKDQKITKRNVLRQIASLFDPMGWIAPSVILAKMFMQKLWLRQLDWDEELSIELSEEWKSYQLDLHILSEIRIPRWVGNTEETKVELHGFADASEKGFAAVVYTRTISKDQKETKTALIMAKTKVAPVKQISLPRLELCAATLLSRLLKHTMRTLKIDVENTFAWSDSKVTLAWIKGDPNRWTPFVKNRVIEIRNNTETRWLYINTKENPADPASRGVLPNKLKNNVLWWNGPPFLQDPDYTIQSETIPETDQEVRMSVRCSATNIGTEQEDERLTLVKKYSSLKKLLHVVAYCCRWLNLKLKKNTLPKEITCEERREALTLCVKIVQEIDFPEEIRDLERKMNIKKSSRLLPLNPYKDNEGVLRVGGRLRNAKIESGRKHPIILTKDNALIPLLLDDAHKATLHGGPQLMSTYLQNNYWIIKGGQVIKNYYKKCMRCAKYNAHAGNQQMGNLPDVRVNPSRPFSISGVDFAGPIFCRMSKGRGTKSFKAYISLFVCMATKALHLELVSDMTAEAFIACFKRFIARRGHCHELWSDHGTNFVASEKILMEMWEQGKGELPEELRVLLDAQNTRWRYIPPGAPNFGGLWEAGIKSVKYHLKRVIGESTLTFEELYTVLTQIEACLNSRPLVPHGDDLECLTPAHFLIGAPTVVPLEKNIQLKNITPLERWRLTQNMVRDFWSKWQTEYLSRLQQRPKWHLPQKDLDEGDLVLIKDPKLPPATWRLGRILKKYIGTDGLTRMYDVRTASGVMQRSISKLCRLPD